MSRPTTASSTAAPTSEAWAFSTLLLLAAVGGAAVGPREAFASAWSDLGPSSATGWKDVDSRHDAVAEQQDSGEEPIRPVSAEESEGGPAFGLTADAKEADGSADGSPDDDAEPSGTACCEADRECRDALKRLRADRISSIDLDIRVGGRPGNDYPCECRLEGEEFKPRCFATTTFTWKAAGYCHKPLYFEQPALERYGHSHGFIPDFFLSGAHFFVTLPILPYKMGVELPWECVYPLGYYRPGNCAPWTCPAVPISVRGLALEAATITGVVFLLP